VPYKSPRQRRYVYARAREGSAWAIKFIKDSGGEPPEVDMKKALREGETRKPKQDPLRKALRGGRRRR
jgi:hypothetical protein